MMTIKPVLYIELIDYGLWRLLNSNNPKFKIIKDNSKYIFATFVKREVKAFLKECLTEYINERFKADRNNRVMIFDTCSAYSSGLNDLYLSRVSKRKQTIINNKIAIKYFLRERYIKLPEEQISKIFDKIFDEWFKKSEFPNIYFVRCNSLPAKEAVKQAKDVLKGALLDLDEHRINSKFLIDMNDFIYSRLKNVIYPINTDFQHYIERLIFPHAK